MKWFFFITLLCLLFIVSCSDYKLDLKEPENEPPPDLEWTWIPYDSELLQISGRGNYEKKDHMVLSWSSSTVTVAFVGTALELKIWTDALVYLNIFVDGEETPSSVVQYNYSDTGPSVVPVVSDLPYGLHVVTLYKKTESNLGDWFFYGLRVLGQAEKDLLPKAKKRKLEFVGNSITCGCDVLVPLLGMEFDPIYEDSYYGYAGQTAKILEAEAHVICSSGHGLNVNVDGTTEHLLPEVYSKTGTQSPSSIAWDHNKWHPDAIVINMGTNDFVSGMIDSADFVNSAIDFVQEIRSYHPKAKIVLLDGPMLTGENKVKCRRYLDVVKDELKGRGEDDLYRFSFEPRGDSGKGVYHHPVKEEAFDDAKNLSAWMRSEFGWK